MFDTSASLPAMIVMGKPAGYHITIMVRYGGVSR